MNKLFKALRGYNHFVLAILFTVFIVLPTGGVFFAWKFINKSTEDFADKKASQTFSFQQIIDKTLTDTASLNKLKDVLVAVNGQIKKITKDEKSVTIELGDTTSMSSITCQFDNRHLEELRSVNEGSQISVKGNITGFSIDTELGLGNTIEMKSCTLNK